MTPQQPQIPPVLEGIFCRAAARREENPKEALRLYQQALELAQAEACFTGVAHALRGAADCHVLLSQYEQGLALALQAKAAFEALGDRAGMGHCLVHVGAVRMYQADYAAAHACFAEALEIALDARNTWLEALARNNLAWVFSTLGSFGFALEHYLKALELFRAVADPAFEAMVLCNLAAAHLELEDYDQALEFARRSLELRQQLRLRLGQADVHNLRGYIYYRQKRLGESIVELEQAIALYDELGDRDYQCASWNTLGQAHLALGATRRALECFGRALELATLSESPSSLTDAWRCTAEAHLQAGDPLQALADLERALQLGDDNLSLRREVLETQSRVLEALGRFEEALQAHKALRRVELRLKDEQLHHQTLALSIRYKLEQERQRSAELAQVNAALEALNQEKSRLLEELRRQAELLERQSLEDPLTELANRRHLESCLHQEFARVRRTGRPLTVAVADIDNFKSINDQLTHPVGDEVLRVVARLLQDGCRAGDTVGRYGGEEFVLVFPETTLEEARHVCERLRQAVEGYPWHSIHPDLRVTLSFGLCDDTSDPSHEPMISRADALMLEAKREGKNRVKMPPGGSR